ncbi:hypothetical protein OGAPHI_001983 [Ogataea philodendri]|uniref:Uncharacterized protein n=1 Tax=Ogataea philodendri TaxID=1378263 RepID=A0A9P8PB45_9ASCO|nr:uncharacterized protein OGAPHI_001983 [Ogataea philodendri]KAH3668229.1 hypothetical protein OGAPHI_001983 [Ogataea philodendri]
MSVRNSLAKVCLVASPLSFLRFDSTWVPRVKSGNLLQSGRLRQLGADLFDQVLVVQSSSQTPEEEPTSVAPLQLLTDGALGHHASSSVVQVGKLHGNLSINRKQLLLSLAQLFGQSSLLLGTDTFGSNLGTQALALVIQTVHVDGWVNNDPRSTSQFSGWRDVCEDWLLEVHKSVHNISSVLENLVVHVSLTTRESSPVGQNHQWQLLTVVEVTDGLSSLEGRVWIPNLTGFLHQHLGRILVGGVGRSQILHSSGLHTDNTHRNTSKTGSTNNNSLGPSRQCFLERATVEQTGLEVVLGTSTFDQPSDVVSLVLDWLVVAGSQVRNTISVHDLCTTKLQVGRVDFSTKNLVDGWSTGQNDRLTFDLDSSLTKSNQVSTDTNRSAGNQSDGENVLVSSGGGTGNQTGPLQTLNTKTFLHTNDGSDDITFFTVLNNSLGGDTAALSGLVKSLKVLRSQVQVGESLAWVCWIVPINLVIWQELFGNTNSGTRVGRKVDSWDTQASSILSDLVEETVLFWTKGTNLEGDVVGNNGNLSSSWILWGFGGDLESHHTNVICTRLSFNLSQTSRIVGDQLNVLEDVFISAHDSDLCTSDSQTPKSSSKTFQETTKGTLNIFRSNVEHSTEIDEDVVQVGVGGVNDLQSVQDITHQSVCFRCQVIWGSDVIFDRSSTDDTSGEVSLVNSRRVLCNGFVDMDISVLGLHRLDVEVGQSTQLQLESKCWLNVSDHFVFNVGTIGSLVGEVFRIRTDFVTDNKSDSSNQSILQFVSVEVDDSGDFFLNFLLSFVSLGRTNENVTNVDWLRAFTDGSQFQTFTQDLVNIINVGSRNQNTGSERLRVIFVDHKGQIRDGKSSVHGGWRLDVTQGLRNGVVSSSGKGWQLKSPCNNWGRLGRSNVVLDFSNRVSSVSSSDINLSGSSSDPWV